MLSWAIGTGILKNPDAVQRRVLARSKNRRIAFTRDKISKRDLTSGVLELGSVYAVVARLSNFQHDHVVGLSALVISRSGTYSTAKPTKPLLLAPKAM